MFPQLLTERGAVKREGKYPWLCGIFNFFFIKAILQLGFELTLVHF